MTVKPQWQQALVRAPTHGPALWRSGPCGVLRDHAGSAPGPRRRVWPAMRWTCSPTAAFARRAFDAERRRGAGTLRATCCASGNKGSRPCPAGDQAPLRATVAKRILHAEPAAAPARAAGAQWWERTAAVCWCWTNATGGCWPGSGPSRQLSQASGRSDGGCWRAPARLSRSKAFFCMPRPIARAAAHGGPRWSKIARADHHGGRPLTRRTNDRRFRLGCRCARRWPRAQRARRCARWSCHARTVSPPARCRGIAAGAKVATNFV